MENVTWDLQQIPTARLLEMLRDNHDAHNECADKNWKDDRRAHYATHFYNLRWSVARELERRGFDAVQALNVHPDVYRQAETLAKGGMIQYPTTLLLSKAVTLKSGERWITVHPHGADEPGVPVLIREHEDGSASIIGGAGGSLNFVRLTKVKSPEEYKEQAKERSAERRKDEKERKANLTPEQRELERSKKSQLETQQRAKEHETIKRVYGALGLPEPKIKTVPDIIAETGVDEASAKIAHAGEVRQHLAYIELVRKATQNAVMNDHELAASAGLGDISLGKVSDTGLWAGKGAAGIDLISGDKPKEGAGVQDNFGKRAAEHGATADVIREESKLVRERAHQKQGDEAEAASHAIGERTKAWAQTVKKLKEEGVVGKDVPDEVKLPDAAKVMEVLRATKELDNTRRIVAKETGKLKKEGPEAKPFVLDTSDDVDEQVVKEFRDEAEVRAARALLGKVEKTEGLENHIRAGAFDVLNDAALTVGGREILGRDVVDFLGSAGAAQLLAQRLRQSLDPEQFADVAEAASNLHAKTNREVAEKAVATADEHLNAAKEIELGTVQTPVDIVTARALNEKRIEHVEAARKALGDAYGRTAALGELALALKKAGGEPGPLTVDLGDTSRESAITMARAFGLTPETGDVTNEGKDERDVVNLDKIGGRDFGGDYLLESTGGKTMLTLHPSAFAKMAQAADPEEIKAYERSQAVKRGAVDEEGWLPAGIERRPNSTFNDPGYELGRFDSDFQMTKDATPEELDEKLRDFIGAQAGEGVAFDDIRTSLYSPEFKTARIPEHLHGHFDALRDRYAPFAKLTDEERAKYRAAKDLPNEERAVLAKEKLQTLQARTEQLRQDSEERARAFSAEYKHRRGMTDAELVSLHTQPIPITAEQTPEAIHRTLAAKPHGAVAFKPVGQLQDRDRATLRDYFVRNIAGLDPDKERDERREQVKVEAEKAGQVPDATQMGMFGDDELPEAVAPPAGEKEAPKEKAAPTKSQAAWDGYVKAMGGHQKAFETLQAIVRGEAVKEYAKHHARVFGKPLKVGAERLPNWEGHLIGRLPEEEAEEATGGQIRGGGGAHGADRQARPRRQVRPGGGLAEGGGRAAHEHAEGGPARPL
jgi:hypothetical protein